MKTVKSTTAISSGNQPPWKNFMRLAAKNDRSTNRKNAETGSKAHSGTCHARRATTVIKIVVMTNVPVTAIP